MTQALNGLEFPSFPEMQLVFILRLNFLPPLLLYLLLASSKSWPGGLLWGQETVRDFTPTGPTCGPAAHPDVFNSCVFILSAAA